MGQKGLDKTAYCEESCLYVVESRDGLCVCVCVCVACLKDTTVVGDEAGWKSLGKSGKMLKE